MFGRVLVAYLIHPAVVVVVLVIVCQYSILLAAIHFANNHFTTEMFSTWYHILNWWQCEPWCSIWLQHTKTECQQKRIQGAPPCPQDFFLIMKFSGNFKGKTPILSIFWAQGPPLRSKLCWAPLTKILYLRLVKQFLDKELATILAWPLTCCQVCKGAGSQSVVSCVTTISLVGSNSKWLYRGLSKAERRCLGMCVCLGYLRVPSSSALVYYPYLSVCLGTG